LPKTVNRQRRGCDLNPGPSAPESSTLTTRLPSHLVNSVKYIDSRYACGVFMYVRACPSISISPKSSPFIMGIRAPINYIVPWARRSLRHKWYLDRFNRFCRPHHTHPFNGPLSGTTRVSRYQKGKTNLDFPEAGDSEWQWHQLGHMQVCTSLQT